jgi:multidrug efflux pump subunit AcrA (membrane-fusion protein)
VKQKKLYLWPAALVFFWACSRDGEAPGNKSEEALVKDVEVVSIQPETVEEAFESVGTVKARKSAVLSSKIVGTIVSVSAQEGDRVKKGQTLMEIDGRELRAELLEAQAALEEADWATGAAESAVASARGQRDLAAATFKRYESLVAKGSVTPHEFDEVNAKYRIAAAELKRAEGNLQAARARQKQAQSKVSYAQTRLGYTVIAAPFDGVVTAKIAEIGALASPAGPLMTVEQTDRYRLEVQVGESWLLNVKLGISVPIVIEAIQAEVAGRVGEIVPAVDPQSRTSTIKIDLPSHPLVRSGLYGKARFPGGRREVLLVPSDAVVEKGQLVGVYTVDEEGLARLRLIKTGKRHDRSLEVLSGLAAGDRVVVRGIEKISDGNRVASPAAN